MIKYIIFLLTSLAFVNQGYAQNYSFDENDQSIYDYLEISQTLTSDDITIDSILNNKVEFYSPEKYWFYKTFSDSTFWVKIPVKNSSSTTEQAYLVIENAYLLSGDFWVTRNNEILQHGHHHSYKTINDTPRLSNYPTWKFSLQPNEEITIYVKLLDRETRTRLELHLFDETGFNAFKTQQIIYQLIYVVFIGVIMIMVLLFSIGNKEIGAFFYILYLLFLLIDHAAIKGFGQTYIWYDSPYLINNVRSLSHGLMLFFISLFFAIFYNRWKMPKWAILYFKAIAICLVPFFVMYVIKIFGDPFPNFYRLLWQFIMLTTASMFLVHLFLFIKKRIPVYIAVAFLLPIIGTQFRHYFVPHHQMEEWAIILSNNAYFYSIALEVLLVSYFVINSAYRRSSYFKEELQSIEKKFEVLKKQNEKSDVRTITLKSKAVISTGDITYIKSDGHYLEFYLHKKNKPEIDRNTLKEMESIMPNEKFIRVHKSYMVNVDYIKIINSNQLMLENGIWIKISRTYKPGIRRITNSDISR